MAGVATTEADCEGAQMQDWVMYLVLAAMALIGVFVLGWWESVLDDKREERRRHYGGRLG
jgi:hypothetical protein